MWRIVVASLLLISSRTQQLELGQCIRALGMESGAIKDFSISASSAYDSGSVGPQHGRLRNDKNGGAWCPRQMVSRDAKEFLEINLEQLHVVTAGRTQGRFGNGQGQEYAEEYMVEYWRPTFTKWKRWKNREGKELLSGNTNTYTVVEQKFDPPVIATKIRLLPYSDHVRTVCMRVELVGCKSTDGLVSYSGPQGSKRGLEMDLSDRTYDGLEDVGFLSDGLGQLVDGQKGQDNFRLDTGHGKAYEWVGWKNDTPGWSGLPLELVFEFDKVRNFSAVHLHTNNLFTKDVQVFSHARIFFSLGGNIYSGEPVYFSYMPDLVLEHARNVTVKLHNRIGKFLKLQLYFASKWILLSEISFDSVIVSGNYTTVEEEDVVISESETDTGKEYSLQRDEVKTITPGSKINRNPIATTSTSRTTRRNNEEAKPYIGFVIGMLTILILILAGAIFFIVYRNQRIKSNSVPPCHHQDKLYEDNNLKMDDCDKVTAYEDTLRAPVCHQLKNRQPHSPDYTEVPDVISQEYSTPGIVRDFTSTSLAGGALHKAPATKPPPIPPPPETYYGELRDLKGVSGVDCESPTFVLKSSRHFTLPPSPGPHEANLQDDVPLEVVPYERLKIIERIGGGQFGDVHLCKLLEAFSGESQLCVVNTLRKEELRDEFAARVKTMAKLKDPNIGQLLGGCLDCQPIYAITEYGQMGDLCQFLQDHLAETATPLTSTANTLSYGCLIFMATQIASGMKCMETYRFVHKDLAARNCLVCPRYQIKISDLGNRRELYVNDYCQIGNFEPIPVRWMAWESILLRKYTTKSDVWSFAVTLWEILTFAREQPFEDLSDEKVIENVTHFYQDNGNHELPIVPINCPKEIYDLMCECWQRNESDRPTFREIHLFLQRKNLGYTPDLH